MMQSGVAHAVTTNGESEAAAVLISQGRPTATSSTEGAGFEGAKAVDADVTTSRCAAANGNIPKVGFVRVNPQLTKDAAGTWRIGASSPAVDAATQTNHANWVTDDIDGRARTGAYDVGAHEVTTAPATRAPLTTAHVGPKAP
ncbi:choice-of-anchor Q domain-containing protein [Microbacterium sp. 69-10]|uniref:choice-of-anchor Q domain-containing protein n=1 Tax=Microbacterium sp. 69-10 TaxID=1895783 RepID=UPI0025EF1B60|nr:choice-of-anchor Q domain-containing protein [Microbacterium sp. 69-10]